MATSRPFTVDPVQTAIAIGYQNSDVKLIAERVLPVVPVGGEKFSWMEYPLDENITLPETFVGRRGRVNEVEGTGVEKTEAVNDHALDAPIPQTDIDAANALRANNLSSYDPEARHTTMLMQLVRNRQELRVATLVQDINSYDASLRITLSGTSQFNDQTNSTPIEVINAAIDAMLDRPNRMVLGQAAWTKLKTHPHIIKAVQANGTDRGNATRQQVAELFELDEILVGEGWLNTAKPGQAPNRARIWGKDIMLHKIDRQASNQMGLTFGYIAAFGDIMAGSFRDEKQGIFGSEIKRVGFRRKEIIAAKSAGYIIKNAIA